jgi:hypothetical protein
MKLAYLVAAMLLSISCLASASTYSNTDVDYERTGHIRLIGSLDGWRPLNDHSLIIWATPFQPYLVELSRRSYDLKFVQAVAVTSTAGQIAEKFDSVIVDGIRYPINAIYKLNRETAKKLGRTS